MRGTLSRWVVAVALVAVVVCAAASAAAGDRARTGKAAKAGAYRHFGGSPTSRLGATIRRTKYGVPHIVAKDFRSAAYGEAYAFAEDNLCTLADSVVTVAGERSRYFGPDGSWVFSGNGTRFNNLQSDFFYGRINKEGQISRLLARKPPEGPLPELRQSVQGFVAGYNAYLRDVGGAKGLTDPRCKGKPWVRPISDIDLYRRFFQLGSLASSGVAIDGIAGAQPVVGGLPLLSAARRKALVPELGARLRSLGGLGSNAIGLGGEATDNGRGMMLGNPHFPWAGAERLYQQHLTIPGKLDVSGGTLYGVPAVLIGHTRGLAWSHTVATAWRFTPFELKLVPGDPHSYLYDGKPRKMKATTVTVKAKKAGGGLENRSTTLYETVHGPMFTSLLGLPLFPWTAATGYALGDVNADNFRYLNHFLETDRAQTVGQYDQIERRYQGIPWVNSLAADKNGDAYYSMNGAIPNVPDSKVSACPTTLGAATFSTLGLPILDGARSACSWGSAPGAAAPGLLPSSRIPTLLRRDYVENGNDSHWLTNPRHPLEGYDRIVGIERAERTPRTRLGLKMIEDRLAGRDGLPGRRFTLRDLQRVALGDRQYLGELWRGPLVSICRAHPNPAGTDVSAACPVLARWDGRDDLDSKGALLFRRFAQHAFGDAQTLPTGTEGANTLGPRPFTVPFSASDPVNTPRGLADNAQTQSALASAVKDLRAGGIPLDATLRKYQQDGGGGSGKRTSIPGGPGGLGVFNAISAPWNGHGMGPVEHGSSFIMAAQFRRGSCPVREGTFVTYGESENPRSPHRTDYTRAFSAKRWNPVPFCLPSVLASKTLSVSYVGNACTPRGGLKSARVGGRARRLRVRFRRARRKRVQATLYRAHSGRLKRVRTFRKSKSFTYRRKRGLGRGVYALRLRIRTAGGKLDERWRGFTVGRHGRIKRLARWRRDPSCARLERFEWATPLLGRSARLRFRLDRTSRVTLRVYRGRKRVKRLRYKSRRGEKTYTVKLRRLKRGRYRVRLDGRGAGGHRFHATVRARRR